MIDMKDIEKILNEAWNSINYYQGGSLQIGVDSILEWYVAYHCQAQVLVTPKTNEN